MKWAIQVTLISMDDSNGLHDAITGLGHECIPLWVVPFSDDLPDDFDLDISEPVIGYGSTKLCSSFHKSDYTPGVFFNPSTFDVRYWNETNGQLMLNPDVVVTTLEKFDSSNYDDAVFVRPVGDLKAFAGGLVFPEDMKKWQENLDASGLLDYSQTEIIVSSPKILQAEFRCFVAGNKIVDAARYRLNDRMAVRHCDEKEITRIEEFMQDVVRPHDICVMDVADTPTGLKVIEFNCMNGSGFYQHDKVAIVDGVTKYVEEHYV